MPGFFFTWRWMLYRKMWLPALLYFILPLLSLVVVAILCGIVPKAAGGAITSKAASNGLRTVVKYQRVLSQRYFDVAGFPGRTVGLDDEGDKRKTAGK